MATLTIRCQCGEEYHASDDSIGRRIRCRQCRRVFVVTRPEPVRASSVAATPRIIIPVSRPRWAPRCAPQLARAVTVLSWAYLALVCLSAAAMWTLGDRTILGTVLLFMGRWVFLLPLTVLVPAALYYRRFLLLPLLAAGLVVLGPIMGARSGWRRLLPAPSGMKLRVVSFNADADDFV